MSGARLTCQQTFPHLTLYKVVASGTPPMTPPTVVFFIFAFHFKLKSYLNTLYLGICSCKAEGVTNTTFARSQVLCNSWHLVLIVTRAEVSHRHIAAVHQSLSALFTDHTWITRRGVPESQGSCHILALHF